MHHRFTHHFRTVLVIPALFALALFSIANAAPDIGSKDQAMNSTEKNTWATHCVGRFLIDLPADAEYVGGHYEYGFAKFERQSMDHSAFLQEVDSFEKRLRDTKHKSGTTLLVKQVAPNENTRLLGYWETKSQDAVVDISGYRWLNGQRYLVRAIADSDKVEGALADFGAILANLQAMKTDAPTTKGFCIEQALIADDGTSKNENLNVRFRLRNNPDIVLDIATNRNTGKPPESLLSRKPSVFSGLGLLGATIGGISNIKEGDRKIGEYPGQEWLLKAPNDHGQKAHLFTWEAPGLYRDALHPQIRFDLQSGNFDGGLDPKPISMTDKQMLELWDKILNSLRLRPTDDGSGAGGKPSPQTSNGNVLPLGELVRTGAICPQNGYWHCPENDVHGSTRLFKAGDVMPPAIIKRDLSFVERLRGSSDQHSTSTVWRLVQYDDPIAASTPASSVGDDTIQPSSDA